MISCISLTSEKSKVLRLNVCCQIVSFQMATVVVIRYPPWSVLSGSSGFKLVEDTPLRNVRRKGKHLYILLDRVMDTYLTWRIFARNPRVEAKNLRN